MSAEDHTDNTITVIGTGRADAVPDLLLVSLAVVGGGADVAEALDAASASTAAVAQSLSAAGVAPVDVATADLSVNQRWGEKNRVTGYDCLQSLSVVLRDLAASGRILREVATAAGSALRVDSVSRSISEPGAAQAAARTEAFAEASAKAEQLAELAGRRLGAILSIDETAGGGPHPVMRNAAKAVALGSGARDVPIEAGSQRLETSLLVRWTLVG
ncbi:MAG: SIMPL domain-containing protein [bacterium]